MAVQQTLEQAAKNWPFLSADGTGAVDGPGRRHYTNASGRTIVVYFQYHTLPALAFEHGRLIGWPHRTQGMVDNCILASDVRSLLGEPRRIRSFRSRMEEGAYRIELWFYEEGESPLMFSLGHVYNEELGRAIPVAEPRLLGSTVGFDEF